MAPVKWICSPKHRAALAAAFAFALSSALSTAAIGAAEREVELYRWLDHQGEVRYTSDLSRIPNSRRNTVVRVIPQSVPSAASSVAPDAAALPGADPFNAPGQARAVDARDLAPETALGGRSWPELDTRIAELETLVAQDEETIKQMISTPQTAGDDDLIHSQALREIAARLPVLQAELAELKRWRDDPDTR